MTDDATPRGWTPARRQLFLDTLIDTCNVRAAVAAVGMASSGLYYLRQRDPDFAAQWRDALTIGYERLEQALLRRALSALGDDPDGAALPVLEGAPANATPGAGFSTKGGPIDIQLAMQLLNMHRGTVSGRGSVRRANQVTREQTDASLRRKLDALRKSLEAQT